MAAKKKSANTNVMGHADARMVERVYGKSGAPKVSKAPAKKPAAKKPTAKK